MSRTAWHIRQKAIRAGKEVGQSNGKTYVDGKMVYDSDAQEDQTLYTPEQEMRLNLYGSALDELAEEDRRYTSNYNLWQRWDKRLRLWWIERVEQDAKDGKNTIGVDIVTRAAMIRMTRSTE